MFYKNWPIFNFCQKKNYIILNFNYHMVNTFLVIFLNKKVGSFLNLIRKVSLLILPTTFWTTKKKKKKVKGIKINLDFIFNNFPVHCTDLRLVIKQSNNPPFPWAKDLLCQLLFGTWRPQPPPPSPRRNLGRHH